MYYSNVAAQHNFSGKDITVMVTVSVSSTKDDPPDFQEAEIFGPHLVNVGENLQLKCSIFDRSNSSDKVIMYLCKNGVGVMMKPLGKKDDHTFFLRNVLKQDSGNYSCVYSLNKYNLYNARASGRKSIQVQVAGTTQHPNELNTDLHQLSDAFLSATEHPQMNLSTNEENSNPVQISDDPPDFWPAEIFGVPRVKVGENIELKCIIFERSNSSDKRHMYLCKNGVGVMMELLGKRDEHTFILKNVSVQDSGSYSCVYSPNKYSLNKVRASGHKTIQVQVTELFQCQGQSGQDNNTGHCDGVSERVTQAVNRRESLDGMCEYSTIPDLKVKRRPVDVCNADSGTYSLANDCAVYSLVQYSDVKTKSQQPAAEAVYAKVQKKKEKAYDDSFIHYSDDDSISVFNKSGQDNNTGHCEGEFILSVLAGVSERVTQAVNREESLNDMCVYATIPDLKGVIQGQMRNVQTKKQTFLHYPTWVSNPHRIPNPHIIQFGHTYFTCDSEAKLHSSYTNFIFTREDTRKES
ncbi:hypothetical protein NFI96_008920 [Prochilodus magdalenae]|nr:hypothetical protein NFI96_008920 [Prochilodus magdalenae]